MYVYWYTNAFQATHTRQRPRRRYIANAEEGYYVRT